MLNTKIYHEINVMDCYAGFDAINEDSEIYFLIDLKFSKK